MDQVNLEEKNGDQIHEMHEIKTESQRQQMNEINWRQTENYKVYPEYNVRRSLPVINEQKPYNEDQQLHNDVKKQHWLSKFFLEILSLIPLIDPFSKKKVLWDAIITIMRVYLIFWLPILISFSNNELEDKYALQLIICSIMFIVDQILTFNTIIFQMGFPIINRIELFYNQLNYVTILEFFSIALSLYLSVQFFLNQFSINIANNIGWSKIFLIFLIVPTKNILSFIDNILHRLQPNRTICSFIDLGKLVCTIFLFQHIFTCSWITIGIYHQKKNRISWLDLMSENEELSWVDIYLEGLYFISVTAFTVGYGDISPQNKSEKIFIIVYMFFCTLQLSYCVNAVGNILTKLKKSNEEIQKKITLITEFMRNRKTEEKLQKKIRKYLEHIFCNQQQMNDKIVEGVIQLLPKEFSQELIYKDALNVLNQCSQIKSRLSQNAIKILAFCAEFRRFTKDEQSIDLRNIYVIVSGSVEQKKNGQNTELTQDEFFGYGKNQVDDNLKYRFKEYSHLLVVQYQHFSIFEDRFLSELEFLRPEMENQILQEEEQNQDFKNDEKKIDQNEIKENKQDDKQTLLNDQNKQDSNYQGFTSDPIQNLNESGYTKYSVSMPVKFK